ncbi:hypothetical protein WJX74_002057 [Apatococcus lobatus]|uniref:BTB domain-containing protein n=1 Tax=Apatococcus lobatus TaxID=904363 RepID=A0AAW1RAQ5_9CHLO
MTVVELSVGGSKFATTRATLTRDPESMLARMFDGGLPPCQKDSKGRYVIDRNGTAFGYVLDYLRGEPTRSPNTSQERSQLLADAESFQLQGLQAQLAANGVLRTPCSLPGPPQTETWSHMTAMEAHSAAIMKHVAIQASANTTKGLRVLPVGVTASCSNKPSGKCLLLCPGSQGAEEASACRIMTVVELSVGGLNFTTTRATFTRDPESMLARMFDGGLPPCQKDTLGRYVIDLNGTAFGYVLDYLRGEPTRSPPTSQERSQLLADAEYYQANWVLPKVPHELRQIVLDDAYTMQYDLDNMGYSLDIERGGYDGFQGKISNIALKVTDALTLFRFEFKSK